MNRSQWFIERKRIPIDKTTFRVLVIGAGVMTLVMSILFLVQYFVMFDDIVTNNMNKFGTKNYTDTYNTMKFVYLIRFWGNVFVLIFLQFLAYLYYKKTKAGYGFYTAWIILIIGMLITDFSLVKDNWYISLISSLPLLVIGCGLIIGLKELYAHRKALNIQYMKKIRKGEL